MLSRKKRVLAAGQDQDRRLNVGGVASNRHGGELAKHAVPHVQRNPVQLGINRFGEGGVDGGGLVGRVPFLGELARRIEGTQAAANAYLIVSPFEAMTLDPNAYDFMMINLNYHDVYWESAKYGVKRMDPDAFLKTVFASIKPGGIVGVIDHVGAPGDTRQTVEKFHRIDPAVVKADFERAGFKLEAESDLLKNAADDHTLLVFDEKIQGKTDRFMFRFRKPE